MSNGGTRSDAPGPHIDADAVCERCGTVNPEDTFLCRNCGNNLRDQRLRRVSGDQAIAIPGLEPTRGAWIGKLVVAFGILLILWVAINIGRIEDFMAGAQTASLTDARVYWSGPNSAVFDQLAADLTANPITPPEADLAVREPMPGATYDGRYVLMRHLGGGYVRIGDANVRTDGGMTRFVAILTNPPAEVRGEARVETTARIAARDTAGVKYNGANYGATGFAQNSDSGGLECLGLSDVTQDTCSAVAFRVHD